MFGFIFKRIRIISTILALCVFSLYAARYYLVNKELNIIKEKYPYLIIEYASSIMSPLSIGDVTIRIDKNKAQELINQGINVDKIIVKVYKITFNPFNNFITLYKTYAGYGKDINLGLDITVLKQNTYNAFDGRFIFYKKIEANFKKLKYNNNNLQLNNVAFYYKNKKVGNCSLKFDFSRYYKLSSLLDEKHLEQLILNNLHCSSFDILNILK